MDSLLCSSIVCCIAGLRAVSLNSLRMFWVNCCQLLFAAGTS